MGKLPAFPLYYGDWLRDAAVSACAPATRGIWMDLLCAMHDRGRMGELRGTTDQLARLARCSAAEIVAALTDLQITEAADVTIRNGVVTVINRRMRREAKLRDDNRTRKRRSRGHGDVTEKSRLYSSSSSSKTPLESPQGDKEPTNCRKGKTGGRRDGGRLDRITGSTGSRSEEGDKTAGSNGSKAGKGVGVMPAEAVARAGEWLGLRERLRRAVDEESWGAWIAELVCLGRTDGGIWLAAPSEFMARWVSGTYREAIAAAAGIEAAGVQVSAASGEAEQMDPAGRASGGLAGGM